MTRNPTPGPKLLPFADALVEDWMTLSDEEVFAEFRADGFDPEVVAAELRAHIQGLVAENGKARLARARAGLGEARADRAASNVFNLSISRKQEILARFAANDGRLGERMTMAARKGEGASEREIDDILRDLRDLGAIDDQGNPR
jgi:3-oxoacyl-ACP reductase-like protein